MLILCLHVFICLTNCLDFRNIGISFSLFNSYCLLEFQNISDKTDHTCNRKCGLDIEDQIIIKQSNIHLSYNVCHIMSQVH
uniref:Ubiquitin-protein ligase bre-1, putative n=1 Tax=Arundo donax TaxID=35708 RepID=A0A0A9D547_ARUDO